MTREAMGRSAHSGADRTDWDRLGRTTLSLTLPRAEESGMAHTPTPTVQAVPFERAGEDLLAGHVFGTCIDASPQWLDDHLVEVTQVPHGRKGLWGALTTGLVPAFGTCGALLDTALLGPVHQPMFEIDPLASIDLTVL